jgi:hypothetical protein
LLKTLKQGKKPFKPSKQDLSKQKEENAPESIVVKRRQLQSDLRRHETL